MNVTYSSLFYPIFFFEVSICTRSCRPKTCFPTRVPPVNEHCTKKNIKTLAKYR